jgi:uncharacterized protein (DUF1330 family)
MKPWKERRAPETSCSSSTANEAARAYFYSAEYQAARALRQGAAEIEMVLVEGV